MLEKELLFMDGDLHFMCFMLQNIAYNSSGDIKSLLIKIASIHLQLFIASHGSNQQQCCFMFTSSLVDEYRVWFIRFVFTPTGSIKVKRVNGDLKTCFVQC